MKTAISIPDSTFERVERKAAQLGWSRSQFYRRAAEHLLDELDQESLTGAIDAALKLGAADDDMSTAATAAGRRTLASGEW